MTVGRALVIQHLAPEGPARIAAALVDAEVEVVVARVDLDPGLPPSLDGFDALVVMGGPMAADADTGFPTRRTELERLAEAVDRGIPVLGVCLGAQLLAEATGGACVRGHGLEVGWGEVTTTPAAAADLLLAGLPPAFPVLHWHGDTVILPPGAMLLASSAAYPHQAFRVGAAAWGLQFHLEVGADEVQAFVEAFPDDAAHVEGGAAALLADTPAQLAAAAPVADAVLDRFAAFVAFQASERGRRESA